MTRRFTLAFLAFLAPLLAFSLNHQTPAPLWEHMVEVNSQWENQGFDAVDFQVPIEFKSDIDRIQTHLLLVTHFLRTRQQEGLSADQAGNRLDMLNRLERYAYRAQFPINSGHSYRTPYFIDHEGTACAVGQLIIESGNKAFAERIQKEMNNAYLLDMPYEEIGTWASVNGFTESELAWIQPTYQPGSVWSDLVGGMGGADNTVSFIQEHPNQPGLVIAGDFAMLSGVTCDKIAYFDGQSVNAMGTNGPDGRVYDIEWYDNKLYAGGQFNNNGGSNLAIWDGSTWTYEQVYLGEIYTLQAMSNKLYAGGNIGHNGGALIENVVVLENGFWSGVAGGLDGHVWDMVDYQGTLYLAGDFKTTGVTQVEYVASFDGQDFAQVGTGVDVGMRTLEVEDDTLYAAGLLVGTGIGTAGAFKYNGVAWDSLINPLYNMGVGTFISDIRFVDGRMYVIGDFAMYPLVGIHGNGMASINPTYQTMSPFIETNGLVHDIAVMNNNIVIGGAFSSLNQANRGYIATHTVVLGAGDPDPASFQMFPNPMEETTYIKLPNGLDMDAYAVKVLDMSGREVAQGYQRDWQQFMIRKSNLPTGLYIVTVEKEGKRIWSDKLMVR